MSTILVPIARYPWFVDAVCHNLTHTDVDLDRYRYDLAFVTPHQPGDALEQRLERGGPFRWIRCPLDANNNHLPLLDWAFRHGGLRQHVLVQHCDCFHWNVGWTDLLERVLHHPNFAALRSPRGPHYRVDRRTIRVQHDYLGFFNRDFIVANDLSFNWGRVADLKVSAELLSLIDAGKVSGVSRDTWLDGSHLLGLELGTRFRNLVRPYRWHRHIHLWQFFKWGNRITRDGSRLVIRSKPCRRSSLIYYAGLTSHFFSKDDPACLPFACLGIEDLSAHEFNRLAGLLGNLGEWHPNHCGMDDDCGLTVEWTGEDDGCRFDE